MKQAIKNSIKQQWFFKLPVMLLFFSMSSSSAEYQVIQKQKSFNIKHLTIKKGDKVNFSNKDPLFHNIFSLSDTQFFDLGSFPKGETRSVEFNNTGVLEIECAIHPSMKMSINVTE